MPSLYTNPLKCSAWHVLTGTHTVAACHTQHVYLHLLVWAILWGILPYFWVRGVISRHDDGYNGGRGMMYWTGRHAGQRAYRGNNLITAPREPHGTTLLHSRRCRRRRRSSWSSVAGETNISSATTNEQFTADATTRRARPLVRASCCKKTTSSSRYCVAFCSQWMFLCTVGSVEDARLEMQLC